MLQRGFIFRIVLTSQHLLFFFVHIPRCEGFKTEGICECDRRQEHLDAYQKVLHPRADLLCVIDAYFGDHTDFHQAGNHDTLPESKENHTFDAEKLSHGLVRLEFVFHTVVERRQHNKGITNGDIHDEQNVYVAIAEAHVRFVIKIELIEYHRNGGGEGPHNAVLQGAEFTVSKIGGNR